MCVCSFPYIEMDDQFRSLFWQDFSAVTRTSGGLNSILVRCAKRSIYLPPTSASSTARTSLELRSIWCSFRRSVLLKLLIKEMVVALSAHLVAQRSDLITFHVTSLSCCTTRSACSACIGPSYFSSCPEFFGACAELDSWVAAVQESSSEDVVGFPQRCAKASALFDDLLRILWDTARLIHPRQTPMHRRRPQPRWWTGECFRAPVASRLCSFLLWFYFHRLVCSTRRSCWRSWQDEISWDAH